jgi:hypothetical protein
MITRFAILMGALLLIAASAGFAGESRLQGRVETGKATGGGIAFCCGERVRTGETGFHGSDCLVIENNPRSVNACLEGGFPSGPGSISAGCLSGIWSCEPFVDSNGNVVKNCCCEPPIGKGTGTCLNESSD